MPGSFHVLTLRQLLRPDSLKALTADVGLREELSRPGSFLDLIDRVIPDLDKGERAWLGEIPSRLQEAMRAAVQEVASDPGSGVEVDVQYEPAYDFGLQLYEFDRTLVIRVSGPYPGQPYARDVFLSKQGRPAKATRPVRRKPRAAPARKRGGSRRAR